MTLSPFADRGVGSWAAVVVPRTSSPSSVDARLLLDLVISAGDGLALQYEPRPRTAGTGELSSRRACNAYRLWAQPIAVGRLITALINKNDASFSHHATRACLYKLPSQLRSSSLAHLTNYSSSHVLPTRLPPEPRYSVHRPFTHGSRPMVAFGCAAIDHLRRDECFSSSGKRSPAVGADYPPAMLPVLLGTLLISRVKGAHQGEKLVV